MRQILGIVYDEATKKVLVIDEYGARDATRFFKIEQIDRWGDKVNCELTATINATINPDSD